MNMRSSTSGLYKISKFKNCKSMSYLIIDKDVSKIRVVFNHETKSYNSCYWKTSRSVLQEIFNSSIHDWVTSNITLSISHSPHPLTDAHYMTKPWNLFFFYNIYSYNWDNKNFIIGHLYEYHSRFLYLRFVLVFKRRLVSVEIMVVS